MTRPLPAVLLLAASASAQAMIGVTDLGLDSGFQDTWFGHHQRGRATIVADFDLDGRPDVYLGNPGDRSIVLRNTVGPGGELELVLAAELVVGETAWGGAAADYDNDGDPDLFVAVGGNEGIGFDLLFQNMWFESGGTALSFRDVSATAGIRGPIGQAGSPVPIASGNAVWTDYDNDGDSDLFVNGNIHPLSEPAFRGRNTLWRNDGDGTFSDVTAAVGLAGSLRPTRHSTFLDIDNDGDRDLYESNYLERNVLWRNLLVETGSATFEDVTAAFSPTGEDLGYPWAAFGSTATDLDNDGRLDLVVFMRKAASEPGSPYLDGHALFRNVNGLAFVNVADASGINTAFAESLGVMGCQVGDLNGDGTPDVYVGRGGPPSGNADGLFLSVNPHGALPQYADESRLVDFAAAEESGFPGAYPSYPYRTHGTAFVDLTRDGKLEIAIANGGPISQPDSVREPNRLFALALSPQPGFLTVRARGDGLRVARDGIDTRLALTVRRDDDPPRTLHRVVLGSDCFSAHHAFEAHFYVDPADTVESLRVEWPDGTSETLTAGLAPGSRIEVVRGEDAGTVGPTLTVGRGPGGLELGWGASCSTGAVDYAVYRGTLGQYASRQPLQCSTGGATATTVADAPGDHYFLVVPQSASREGSYGTGAERPPAPGACREQQVGPCS